MQPLVYLGCGSKSDRSALKLDGASGLTANQSTRAKSASSGQLLSFIGKAEGISFDKPVTALLTILGAIITIVAELSKIDIAKDAAFVLTVLWENNQQDKGSVEKGFKLVNKTCEEQGRRLYTQAEYEEILDDLASIKSIDIRSNEIILMEKIWIKN